MVAHNNITFLNLWVSNKIDSEEKIHLFYHVLNIAFLSGLPTDYWGSLQWMKFFFYLKLGLAIIKEATRIPSVTSDMSDEGLQLNSIKYLEKNSQMFREAQKGFCVPW